MRVSGRQATGDRVGGEGWPANGIRRTELDAEKVGLGRVPGEQGGVDLHSRGAGVGGQVAEEEPRGARAHGERVELGVHLGDEAGNHRGRRSGVKCAG